MSDLLALLGAEAALACAYVIALRRGWRRLAREAFVTGTALALTVSMVLLLARLLGDRWDLASRRYVAAISGAIVVPGVLVGRFVAAWLRLRAPQRGSRCNASEKEQ